MNEPITFHAQGRLVDFMRQADEPGLINLAAGVPGLDSLPAAALRQSFEAACEKDGPAIFAYHHPEGDQGLRELLAARMRERGAQVAFSDIITTTGCTQALQLMLSVLVKPGEIVACEAPAYYGMLELLSEAGVRVLPIPVDGGDGLDLAATDELLTRWRPKCLIVCAALSNPSGATVPEGNREKLVEICRRNGVRLIEDDIYGELVDGGAPRSMLAWDDGSTVSYVTSFSKTVSPGLRIGFCIPGKEWHEAVAERKCQQDLHSAVTTEATLREFLASGAFQPHLAGLHIRNKRRRELALETIQRAFPEGTVVVPPRGGYMLWAKLPAAVDLTEARAEARKHRVVFAAGNVFFTSPQETSYLRLNCAKASETELVFGLKKLGEVLCSASSVTA